MDKIKVISLIFLILSVGICTFSACKKDEPEPVTTTVAEQTSTTKNNGYEYNDRFTLTDEKPTQYPHVAPPVPTRKPKETIKASEAAAEQLTTTKKASADNVNEESNGLYILTKTSPVIKGNSVSIIIMGTPDAEYTIEFYETENKKAAYSGLENTKSDSNGMANWTFTVESTCESGDKKVIIKEKNSDKYIQTSITIV